jgi:hypothetical protein
MLLLLGALFWRWSIKRQMAGISMPVSRMPTSHFQSKRARRWAKVTFTSTVFS